MIFEICKWTDRQTDMVLQYFVHLKCQVYSPDVVEGKWTDRQTDRLGDCNTVSTY